MTKISSCSSLSAKSASSLAVTVFGLLTSVSQSSASWVFPTVGDPRARVSPQQQVYEAFVAEEPFAYSLRVSRHAVADCPAELRKIQGWDAGRALRERQKLNWDGWAPWEEKDLKDVRGCEKFPCSVKLNAKEVQSLHSVEKAGRMDAYFGLLAQRVELFVSQGTRLPGEYAIQQADPIAWFEKQGVEKRGFGPPAPLVLRVLPFGDGSFRPVRQILSQDTSQTSERVTHRIRDVYTDHYFDSWGEWIEADCLSTGNLRVVQALMLEFDLFKKKDLISKIARPKMRKALEEQTLGLMRRRTEAWGLSEKRPTEKARKDK